jgi:glyoxylase-like metal-dependent hydrolase (beta-lactamase superfamily II)
MYLKGMYPNAKTGIGSRIAEVQQTFSTVFNLSDLSADGSEFDLLFDDGDEFSLGSVACRVIHTPGHTPACVCYVMGDAVFSGDTIFMPDSGTARCDFPGGSSANLYDSVKEVLYGTLNDSGRVFVGHDYQPGGRELKFETTIGEEKRSNKQLNATTSKGDFIAFRSERDSALEMPKLILPSLQVNLRGGRLPAPESNGVSYLKIPVNLIGQKKE